MSKVSEYLNQHLAGEVYIDQRTRSEFARDASVLAITPEMVVAPRNTNDIRKVATFCWQLAEKGHALSLTTRGGGTNATGGAIGSGAIIDMSRHFGGLLEFDVKQHLLHAQAGASLGNLRTALELETNGLAWLEASPDTATLGGAIAGSVATDELLVNVKQLEVVLSNGDVLQTDRLSRRDVHKKMGQQNFEGDIYRAIDTLLDENAALIERLQAGAGSEGAVASVRDKHGAIDLMPLFIGSQGTLGIISELIVGTTVMPQTWTFVTAAFDDSDAARDMLDQLQKFEVGKVEFFDAELFVSATNQGKRPEFLRTNELARRLIVVTLDDISTRAQAKKAKKLRRLFEKAGAFVTVMGEQAESTLPELAGTLELFMSDDQLGGAYPMAGVGGVYVPLERLDDYDKLIKKLGAKYSQSLAFAGNVTSSIWWVWPQFDTSKVSGKQSLIKFIDEYSEEVNRLGGNLDARTGGGRLRSFSTDKMLDDEVKELLQKIKKIFDPNGILNPDMKQADSLQAIVKNMTVPASAQPAGRRTHL